VHILSGTAHDIDAGATDGCSVDDLNIADRIDRPP
jgi:hypothetical protein